MAEHDDLIKRLFHAYSTRDTSGLPPGWTRFVETTISMGWWSDEEGYASFVRDAMSAMKSGRPEKAFKHVVSHHYRMRETSDSARKYDEDLKASGMSGVGDAVPAPGPGSPGGTPPADVPPPPPPAGSGGGGDGDSPRPPPADGPSEDGSGDRDILTKILEALLKLGGDRKPGGEDSPWWDIEYSAPVTPLGRFWERIKRTTPIGRGWKKLRGMLKGKRGAGGGAGGEGASGGAGILGSGGAGSKAAAGAGIALKFAEAVYEFGKATYAFARDLEKEVRRLAEVGPSQAIAAAELDVNRILRDIKKAEDTAGSSKDLMESLNRFENAIAPLEALLTNISNTIGSTLLDLMSTMAEAVNELLALVPGLKPKDKKDPDPTNWDTMRRMAEETLRKRAAAWPIPPGVGPMGPI